MIWALHGNDDIYSMTLSRVQEDEQQGHNIFKQKIP